MRIHVNSVENKVTLLKQSEVVHNELPLDDVQQLGNIWKHPEVIKVNTLYGSETVADMIVNELYKKYEVGVKLNRDTSVGPHPFYTFTIKDKELKLRIPRIKEEIAEEGIKALYNECITQINKELNGNSDNGEEEKGNTEKEESNSKN